MLNETPKFPIKVLNNFIFIFTAHMNPNSELKFKSKIMHSQRKENKKFNSLFLASVIFNIASQFARKACVQQNKRDP